MQLIAHYKTELATLAAAVVLFCPSAAAQSPPAGLQNLPVFGEIPYLPGGIPANGPIVDPLEDADLILFASHFWTYIDTGNSTGLTNHRWTAPGLLEMEQELPAVTIDKWGGGLELFEALYQHRLQPYDPGGYESVRELIENEYTIGFSFKHWTLHHQLATSRAWDPVAHSRHLDMLVEAYTKGVTTTVRGVPRYDSTIIISDRLELEQPDAWFVSTALASSRSQDCDEEAVELAQSCIDSMLCNLKSMEWKQDGSAGLFGFFGTPGFDCDDFADALGACISNGKPSITASTVRITWKKGTNRKKKGAHQITKISAGGKYWLLDGQVGGVTGPHTDGTPMDGEPALNGPGGAYDREPGSTRTQQRERPLGERPWVEPPPWTESSEMEECFEEQTGLNAEDYHPEEDN